MTNSYNNIQLVHLGVYGELQALYFQELFNQGRKLNHGGKLKIGEGGSVKSEEDCGQHLNHFRTTISDCSS